MPGFFRANRGETSPKAGMGPKKCAIFATTGARSSDQVAARTAIDEYCDWQVHWLTQVQTPRHQADARHRSHSTPQIKLDQDQRDHILERTRLHLTFGGSNGAVLTWSLPRAQLPWSVPAGSESRDFGGWRLETAPVRPFPSRCLAFLAQASAEWPCELRGPELPACLMLGMLDQSRDQTFVLQDTDTCLQTAVADQVLRILQ